MLFEPQDIVRMRMALDQAARALAFAYPSGVDSAVRDQLAKAIVDAAASGVCETSSLCAHALGAIDAKSAA